jgi:hypothetical protein
VWRQFVVAGVIGHSWIVSHLPTSRQIGASQSWRRRIPRIPIRGHGVIIISRRGSRSLKRERQVSSSAAHYDGITGSTGALWTDLQLNDQSLSRGSSRVSPFCCHCACPISIRRAVGTCAGSSLNVRWYLTSGAGRRYQSEYHRSTSPCRASRPISHYPWPGSAVVVGRPCLRYAATPQ